MRALLLLAASLVISSTACTCLDKDGPETLETTLEFIPSPKIKVYLDSVQYSANEIEIHHVRGSNFTYVLRHITFEKNGRLSGGVGFRSSHMREPTPRILSAGGSVKISELTQEICRQVPQVGDFLSDGLNGTKMFFAGKIIDSSGSGVFFDIEYGF
jgi:hypothetical protein